MAGKKARARPVKKAKKALVKRKSPSKALKRDVRSLKKGLKKQAAVSRKTAKTAKGFDKELDLLHRELDLLKKRKKRAGLSDYNRFMRQQIRAGKTFRQAARLWSQRKRQLAKKTRRRSAYNIFISMQLKQGKTMKQAIAAWNRLKNPARKRRPAKRKAKKPVKGKRPAKRKPVRKKKRKPVKKRRVVRKRKIVKTRVVKRRVFRAKRKKPVVRRRLVRTTTTTSRPVVFGERILQPVEEREISNEESALNLLDVYFGEVARRGIKRRLSLDEVIDSYFYALLRLERKGIELNEIKGIIEKGVLKRSG